MHEQKPYVPKLWPRWIETPAGNRMIVNSCQQMSSMMGEEYDENAELVVKAPPTNPAAGRPDPPANASPNRQESVEELLARMAAQSAAAHVDVLKTMDPMGIFNTPEPDEPKPVPAKRGVKAAKE